MASHCIRTRRTDVTVEVMLDSRRVFFPAPASRASLLPGPPQGVFGQKDCTTTDQRDAPTGLSSSCSQADTESPRASPCSCDAEGSRYYPLSDVAVQ
eukprot:1840847-Rhodomonas_salina.1